jgi:tape measure domain-containing protein
MLTTELALKLHTDLLDEVEPMIASIMAARGDMSMEDTKEAFLGVSEMSTLLGLSSVESSRAVNALMQMMSKGVVTSEELKLQMGEVMPNAMKIMAESAKDAGLSVSGTMEEMFKLQEQGKLVSSKVLPHFAKNMRLTAAANGGLGWSIQRE